MRRVHCATCVCGDTWRRDRVDVTAPFYGLVVEVDRIVLAEQRERYLRTRAEHEGEDECTTGSDSTRTARR